MLALNWLFEAYSCHPRLLSSGCLRVRLCLDYVHIDPFALGASPGEGLVLLTGGHPHRLRGTPVPNFSLYLNRIPPAAEGLLLKSPTAVRVYFARP